MKLFQGKSFSPVHQMILFHLRSEYDDTGLYGGQALFRAQGIACKHPRSLRIASLSHNGSRLRRDPLLGLVNASNCHVR